MKRTNAHSATNFFGSGLADNSGHRGAVKVINKLDTDVIVHDCGGDDKDDEQAILAAALDACQKNTKLVIVTGSSGGVVPLGPHGVYSYDANYEASMRALREVLQGVPEQVYEHVEYSDWLKRSNSAVTRERFRSLLIISPQTAVVAGMEGFDKSWPAFSFENAVLQGTATFIENATDEEANDAKAAAKLGDTDALSRVKDGVNCQGNQELIARLEGEGRLSVLSSSICREFKLSVGQLKQLPDDEQFLIAANSLRQMISRINPEHPIAGKLIRQANYELVGGALALVLKESMEDIDINSIDPDTERMADEYLAVRNGVDASEQENTKVNLYKICIAVEKIIPGIWSKSDTLYTKLSVRQVVDDFGSEVRELLSMYKERLSDDVMPPIVASYDLLAFYWLKKINRCDSAEVLSKVKEGAKGLRAEFTNAGDLLVEASRDGVFRQYANRAGAAEESGCGALSSSSSCGGAGEGSSMSFSM